MEVLGLRFLIFELELAAINGHDALVGSIVYVAGRGGPLGNAFIMVGHDHNARLHALNQIDPTTRANLRHLENKNLVRIVTLAWENISLDIGPGAYTFKLGDAIHNPQPM